LSILGYDVENEDLERALKALESGQSNATRSELFEILRAGVIQESLFQSGMYDDGKNAADEYSVDQLAWFVRHPHADEDKFSDRFKERLDSYFEFHGITELKRNFAMESALLRLFQSHQSTKRLDKTYSALTSALIQTPDDAVGPADESNRRDVLEHLANYAVVRNRLLAQLVWQAIYPLCDLPQMQLIAKRQDAEGVTGLTRLVDPNIEEAEREKARLELVDLPLGTLLGLLPTCVGEAQHRRQSLLAIVVERLHSLSESSIVTAEGNSFAQVDVVDSNGKKSRAVFVESPDQLMDAMSMLGAASGVECGDFLLGYSPETEKVQSLFEGCSSPATINVVWGSSLDGLRSRTYKLDSGSPQEVEIHRDLHPARASVLEVDRLDAFELTRLPAPGGLFLALARAKDGSGDERLFAIGEVERFDPYPNAKDPNVRLPSFEKTYLDAVHAIRQAMHLRSGPDKLVWNRLTIFFRPTIALSRVQMENIAERLAPPTVGLGLEKVVIRVSLKQAEKVRSKAQDMIVEWANPTGRGPVLSFALPRHRSIRVLSDYERRVVDARRRGKFYPYELIRTLTSEGPMGGFAEGDFEEMELDSTGSALESVYKRPYGQNQANLVVGRITNHIERFPAGLTRMLIVGDPTRTMGSLAEPECRRIIAAIDMAENLQIPVEWVPISSGAKISFDSGTENLDWTARVLRRIIQFTQDGGVINLIVDGICVGAQSYWNAEATMLNHCRGALVMTPQGCMLLTGKRALEYSGSVAAATNQGIGGLEVIMGPNGQAQYSAPNLREAYNTLFRHYALTYVPEAQNYTLAVESTDPSNRDITRSAYGGSEAFNTVGEIFSDTTNPGRKRPFSIREVINATCDSDVPPIERWGAWEAAETSVVCHAQLGGQPVCVIGIESKTVARKGNVSADGPDSWTSGTLFPQSSRKVARAINSVSGICPVVVLANLSGFDGSPESLRQWQLEYGAQIGRAVVNFKGPIIFSVISRYHGGAYVVFSQTLNEGLRSMALEGSYASVIGGGPAAAVVFPGLVRKRVRKDARVQEAAKKLESASRRKRADAQAEYSAIYREAEAEVQGAVAREFDEIHSVQRAKEVGSLSDVISPKELRKILCSHVKSGVKNYLNS